MIKVGSLNISVEKGTVKKPVDNIFVNSLGFEGDAHAGHWHRQVSLLGQHSVAKFSDQAGRQILPGEFAENITFEGLNLNTVSVLDRFKINDVILEVTQIGKKCHGDSCAIYREVGNCVMPKEGLFARVIQEGTISQGDEVEYLPRTLNLKVITLSDRASSGEYEDLSGPAVVKKLKNYFKNTRWHYQIKKEIIPDDRDQLINILKVEKENKTDLVFTTGGTGIGPRDITPDIVLELSDKEIPGIMNFIRNKYGEKIPNALCSRSVSTVMGHSLVFTLPGSVKAVNEYMDEILKTAEHLIFMLHGLGH